jgi:hypothetical protein
VDQIVNRAAGHVPIERKHAEHCGDKERDKLQNEIQSEAFHALNSENLALSGAVWRFAVTVIVITPLI